MENADWLFHDEAGNEIYGPVVRNARYCIALLPYGNMSTGKPWADVAKKLVDTHNTEIAELRKDAERYRGLLENAGEIFLNNGVNINLDPYHTGKEKMWANADAEIDKVMADAALALRESNT